MYEDITPESIKAEMLADITGVDTREGSYTSNLVSPSSLELWKMYQALNSVIPIAFIDETSGEYIDKRCGEVGITRKAGTKAAVALTFTGTDGTVVPAGTVFLTPDSLEFLTDADATIASGQATVSATAFAVGEAYNVPAGSVTNQYNSIAGLSAVTNFAAAQGGTDPEADADLVAQYYAYLKAPHTSGNIHDYEEWAMEADGVGAVKVTPLQNGAGTVGVLIVGPEKQPVDSTVVSACAAHIEEERPVGATVTVASASALTIGVAASVTIESSTTIETVQTTFSEKLKEYTESLVDAYFKSGQAASYSLLYNKVAYLLMGIDGVTNYSNLQVNGGTTDITIAADQVPVPGTVTINAA